MTVLFDSLTFASGLKVANRFVLAPMTNKQSHSDGTLSDDELHFLLTRADGGFGTVMTCASHVSKEGQGWEGELGCFDDAHVPSLERIASGLHTRKSACIVQIFHGGLRADESASGLARLAPSDLEGAHAATPEDLRRIVGAFADAADRVQRAGADGVEIHGAHGYLLTQFLSRVQNTRTDEYGGSLENRARLVREVVHAVRARTGERFTVGIRLSPEDFGNAVGLDFDESVEVAGMVASELDFVHVSMWRSAEPTKKYPQKHAIPVFRKALPDRVKLLVAGSVWTRDEAEELLEKGADAVALGRSAIANPDFPRRARETQWKARRPPFTPEELVERGLSPKFAGYMRAWKGFVV